MLKEDSTSPSVTTESIFITSVINARENREVTIVDLPGAFLYAENDQDVIMFMRGRLAELMTMIAPQMYRKYVTIEKGQKVLYVKVQKSLYGFEVNPYDPCIANKVINGKQMTIL